MRAAGFLTLLFLAVPASAQFQRTRQPDVRWSRRLTASSRRCWSSPTSRPATSSTILDLATAGSRSRPRNSTARLASASRSTRSSIALSSAPHQPGADPEVEAGAASENADRLAPVRHGRAVAARDVAGRQRSDNLPMDDQIVSRARAGHPPRVGARLVGVRVRPAASVAVPAPAGVRRTRHRRRGRAGRAGREAAHSGRFSAAV